MAYKQSMLKLINEDDDWISLLEQLQETLDDAFFEDLHRMGTDEEYEYEYFLELMQNLDLEPLGSGHFSSVFVCPWDNSKVIKIGGLHHGTSPMGDGWTSWAAFCLKHRGKNPLLPYIHHLVVRNRYYVALLDRLEETDGAADYWVKDAMDGFRNINKRHSNKDAWKQGRDLAKLRGASTLHFNDMGGSNTLMEPSGQPKLSDPMGYSIESSDKVTRILKKLGVYYDND